MSGSLPDFWSIKNRQAIFTIHDMGELAARLGSIVTFDRRGDVIWFDNFEYGLAGLSPNLLTTDSKVILSSDRAATGAFSMLLDLQDTSGGDVEVSKFLFPTKQLKVGFELGFTMALILDTLIFTITYYTPTKGIRGSIRIVPQDLTLDFLNSAGGYTKIRDLDPLYFADDCFHVLKMVIDLEEEEYVRVILDGVGDVLVGNATRELPAAVSPVLFVTMYISCTASTDAYSHSDNWIVTQNEP